MIKVLSSLVVSLVLTFSVIGSAVTSAVGTNLITNPSVEESTNNLPTGWKQSKYGTNTSTFSYDNSGHTGGKSVSVKTTAYTSGDAKWYPTPATVTPNANYTFSDWYKSNVVSSVDAVITTTANKTTYKYLGNVAASSDWKQASFTFKTPANAKQVTFYHYFTSVGQLTTDDYNLETATTTPVPVPTPPTVSISAPVSGTTVSGAQAVSASATSATAITGVQFKLDGSNLGALDTVAPYTTNWDTLSVPNGNHTISAVVTNSANLSATATNAVVNVQNVVIPPPDPIPTPIPTPVGPNKIPNPSVDTTSNGTSPDSWIFSNWGTNTATSTYLNTGHSGNHSVKTEITSYTSGASNWYYADVPVTSGKTYKYENWYQSNVDTEVDAEVTMNDGTVQYFWLGNVPANASWTKFSGSFSAPVGAKSMSIFQILAKKGYMITDDYSLTEYTPAQLNRGIVSLTFDDGWRSIYTNGLPALNKYGFVSTQYLLSNTTEYPDYMTTAMMAAFRDQGSEIAGHSVSHLDLTKQTASSLNFELTSSKTSLQNWLSVPVNNFATPYGAYNSTVINAIKPLYRSHRSTDVGFNSKDNLDIYNIKVQNITNTTTPAQVKAWVDQAILDKTWLVLVYHEVDAGAEDPTYAVTPANLDTELNLIKQSGVAVRTVNQALDEILAQL